jgi:hypothetical protein
MGDRREDVSRTSRASHPPCITHQDLHIPLQPLVQSKAIVIVALSNEVQNPAHTKAAKSTSAVTSGPLLRKLGRVIEMVIVGIASSVEWGYGKVRTADEQYADSEEEEPEGKKAYWARAVG